MPQQLPRLAVVFALAIVALVAARTLLVPATFGAYGHYRAAAVDSIAARPVRIAGRQECEECHDDVAAGTVGVNPRGGPGQESTVERGVEVETFVQRFADEVALATSHALTA